MFLKECVTYIVPEGVCSDGILCGQRAAAEDDEDQDEIAEDVVVDQEVATPTDPEEETNNNNNNNLKTLIRNLTEDLKTCVSSQR